MKPYRGRILALALGLSALAALPWVPNGSALAPPIIAILLALVTRRLFLSLGSAVLVGALLHKGLGAGLRDYAWKNALEPSHLYIIGFTLALLGMVQVTARSGGARGIVEAVARWVRSARGTKLGTFAMGVLVFFDDYANCMLVGPTMRPFADRYRVSREKLAYIVDSTAAPISGIVLISTWVGYEAGLLGDVAKTLGLSESGYALLFSALPFRFYCVLTLVFVFVSSYFDRDFGPMLTAERRAREHGKLVRDGAKPLGGDSERHAEPPPGAPLRWINAALPVGVVVLGTLGGLVVDGGGLEKLGPRSALSFAFWRETLSASENNVQVLFAAALAGAAVAIVLPLGQRILSPAQSLGAFLRGVKAGASAVLVLLLAWALAAVCKDLGTGPVLVAAVGKSLPTVMVPVVTFVVAAAVAFATGTSWGTMAILIPTAVPLAHATGSEPLTLLTMASVLDGAIFGDHCSPISDTTLMSSIAAGSDHVDHVATQLPYALTAMLAALFGGYLPVALGWPPAAAYAMGVAMVVLAIFALGRRVA
ncbi:MAG: Na+/H+ antiporter NhaC family protein [Polyangiaceae bacterium]|nr:Na+/H+ antiporter NhaC family protein [Polyangiaceae bacterium]